MKKLVAENYSEFSNPLNEEQINEGIRRQFEKLDKTNEKAIREFAFKLAIKKYIYGATWEGDAAYKLLKALTTNTSSEKLLLFLQAAATDKFKGRAIIPYADPKLRKGRALAWKPIKNINLHKQRGY